MPLWLPAAPPDEVVIPPAPSTLLDGITAYWPLNETGGVRSDIVGATHLTDPGAAGSTPGKQGNALVCVGPGGKYLTTAITPAIAPGGTSFTVAAWVNLDSVATPQALLGTITPGVAWAWQLQMHPSGGGFLFFAYGYAGIDSSAVNLSSIGVPGAGGWFLLVAWYDHDTNTMYFQGNNGTVHSAPGPTFGDIWSGATELYVGSWEFSGKMDEVGYWERTLTTDERTALYNSGIGATHPFPGEGGGLGEIVHDANVHITGSLTVDQDVILPDGSALNYDMGWADVKAFGAHGDGSADDTVPIQMAIDSFPNGGPVFFPQGVYRITSALVVRSMTQLCGVGYNRFFGGGETAIYGSHIDCRGAGCSAFALVGNARGVNIRDLGLFGAAYSGIGISGYFPWELHVDNVYIDGFNEGISLSQAQGFISSRVFTTTQGTRGVYCYQGGHYSMVDSQHANSSNIVMEQCTSVIIDCTIIDEGAAAPAPAGNLYIKNCQDLVFRCPRMYLSKDGTSIKIEDSGHITIMDTNILPFEADRYPVNLIVITAGCNNVRLINVITDPNGGGDIIDNAPDTLWFNVNGITKLPNTVTIDGDLTITGTLTGGGAGGGGEGAVFTGNKEITGSLTIDGPLGLPQPTPDVFLHREAANVFAQRNGATGQTLQIYNTYTDPSNWERATFQWYSGNFYVGTQESGTGLPRRLVMVGSESVSFRAGNAVDSQWRVYPNGHFLPQVDNGYDIGGVGARLRDLHVGRDVGVGNNLGVTGLIQGGTLQVGTAPTTGPLLWTGSYVGIGTTTQLVGGGSILNIRGMDIAGYMSFQSDSVICFLGALNNDTGPTASSGFVGTFSNHPYAFRTNNVTRWYFDIAGHFVPYADAVYDIGITGTRRVRDLFLSRDNFVGRDLWVAGNANVSHVLPGADNTYDLGSPSFRFRNLYLAGSPSYAGLTITGTTSAYLNVNGTTVQAQYGTIETEPLLTNPGAVVGTVSNHRIYFKTNNTVRWYMGFGGGFLPALDNTYDIGLGSLRPHDVYVGSTLYLGVSTKLQTTPLAGGYDVLALRNGTTPQAWQVYCSYTDDANYERLSIYATTGSDFTISPQNNGAGVLRGLKIGSSASKLGFFGATPVVRQSYTDSNVAVNRIINANTISAADLADVVGTLLQDLRSLGLVG